MAIGTWVTQNKVRPGVYINYVFSDTELINYASEGVMAMPYTFPLNETGLVVEVTSKSIKSKELEKYGIIAGTDSYKYLTTLLKYCSKVILYSVGEGGSKARLSVANEFTATAKYNGLEGNKFAVEVLARKDNKQTFNTYYNNDLVAIQVYDFDEEVMEGINEYIDIEVEGGTVTETVATVLVGGVDDSVADVNASLKSMFANLRCSEVEILAIPFDEEAYDFSNVEDFINEYNANHVQKVVVVYPKTSQDSASKNSEFVIAIAPQVATLANGLVMDSLKLAGYIAAKEAGADYKVDLTFDMCDDIVSITELTNEEIEDNIKKGVMNLSYRSDRNVVIEDDINTLVLLGENQSSSLKANDTLRLLNDISYRIVSYGENVIIGKKKVTETTLNLVKAFVIGIMNEYANEQVIVNFDSNNDVQVVFGEQPDGILCTVAIQKTHSAKKLYFSIGVR